MKKLFSKKNTVYGVVFQERVKPSQIVYAPFSENITIFSDGTKEKSVCLNCIDKPCINYKADEIKTAILPQMPYNNSQKICPTDAIIIDRSGFPEITKNDCIGCGLCLSRCKYGAINLNENNIAIIEKAQSSKYNWSEEFSEEQFSEREIFFSELSKEIIRPNIRTSFFYSLYQHLAELNRGSIGFENVVVRNLFINLGLKCKVRAVGNNDIRFDMIAEFEQKIILGEIGLNNNDILEEPRALLDDFAILKSRYKINAERIIPIIVTLTFPNKRSDVYEVIFDIKNVLGIEIRIISVHFLIIMNLLHLQIEPNQFFSHFLVDKNKKSIEVEANEIISELNQVDPFLNSEYYCAIK